MFESPEFTVSQFRDAVKASFFEYDQYGFDECWAKLAKTTDEFDADQCDVIELNEHQTRCTSSVGDDLEKYAALFGSE